MLKGAIGIHQRVWLVGIPATIMILLFAVGFALFGVLERLGSLPLFLGKLLYGAPFTVLNVLFNWTFGSFIFMEFPRELQFTSRTLRHKMSTDPEVAEMAHIICEQLNKHDPNHC